MRAFGKMLQITTAGMGFLGGYTWAVTRWAGEVGRPAELLLPSAVPAGVGLAVLYSVLLWGLFGPWIPIPRSGSLRVVVSPTAFTLSFAMGAAGIHGALCLLGA